MPKWKTPAVDRFIGDKQPLSRPNTGKSSTYQAETRSSTKEALLGEIERIPKQKSNVGTRWDREVAAQGTGQKKMEEGKRRNSAEPIKEMECQPSVDSMLKDVKEMIQGLNLSVGTMGNNMELLLEKICRTLQERDDSKLQSSCTTQAGVEKMLQDIPSVQYKVNIENFSVLQMSKLEKYESSLFEACDHKCTKRFDHMKTEWGLDKRLRLDTFNGASNGFLVDDWCVIGVELFLVLDAGKGESLSLVKDLKQNTHTWRIDNFSERTEVDIWSEQFIVGGPGGDYKWYICVYPNGAGNTKGKFVSVYLYLGAYSQVPQGGKVYAEYKLRIKHQLGKEDYVKEDRHWFSCRSYSEGDNFDTFIDYQILKNDLLLDDYLIVEADILNIGLLKGLS
ncbi:hypothetical protein RJ640_019467 [Escallonia rubra]|uniref:MATH domain-containing protein n=1 Tax=Escallonia rubra TaxID=112253 RepID=A0AA88URX8_9ASTE|nr:hypothetical protein RJ640_019467 [Escallonia rubra]